MKIPPSRLEAHRGASGAYPENTMLAFAKAREAGALSIETDLSLLADGGFAVFHDSALGRTVVGDASLDSLTSAEIGTMDAGAWRGREFAGETVPLLEGLLHWQADTGMRFNLEMKCHGARQGEAASALAASPCLAPWHFISRLNRMPVSACQWRRPSRSGTVSPANSRPRQAPASIVPISALVRESSEASPTTVRPSALSWNTANPPSASNDRSVSIESAPASRALAKASMVFSG